MALVCSVLNIRLYLSCRLEHYTGECRTNLHLEFGKAKTHCSLKTQQTNPKTHYIPFSVWMALTCIQSCADYHRQYILCRIWGLPGGRFAKFWPSRWKKIPFLLLMDLIHYASFTKWSEHLLQTELWGILVAFNISILLLISMKLHFHHSWCCKWYGFII